MAAPDDGAEESTATRHEHAARAQPPAPAARPPRPPGVLLDRYEVSEELGHGGMGVVYRARDRQLGRDVAIKLVHTVGSQSETLAARLLREAQALARLSHPNVVAVHDVGRTEDGVFVAMELVPGMPGDIWLHERKPPWREVLRVFLDAARGLAAAHAVGLVHRDFKPGNLIIGDDGRVRVLDFGLARTSAYDSSTSVSSSTSDELDFDAPSDAFAGRETVRLPVLAAGSGDDAAPHTSDGAAASSGSAPTAGSGEASGSSPPSRTAPSQPTAASMTLLDVPLTEIGSIVGTPPYMAPEQHMRAGCDARSDQFSFCASLYRGLYRQRAFAGSRYSELKTNILAGKVRPPPRGSDVPGWLHDIVLRGLSVDPAHRWPSMDALIAALARDRDATRRRIIAGAAAVVLVGGGAATWALTRDDPAAACAVAPQELAGIWDAPTKDRVAAAFASTSKPYASDVLASITRALDDYTSRWSAMRREACVATRVRGTQSAELLDLRMECLARRLDGVRALVDVLAAADADVVSRAPQAAASLPSIDACADAESLRAPIRPPDPATKTRVDTAYKTLAKADALRNAGRYASAQQLVAPVIAEAKSIGYRPLEGQALLAGGRIADVMSDFTQAHALFKDAAIAAEAGRDDETAALARNGLVWVIGVRLGRYAEAKELARDAEAKVERLNRSELLQADLDQTLAAISFDLGELEESERRTRRVLETRQRVLGPDDPTIATALGDLADVATQTSRYDEAIDLYRRALAVVERAQGANHPYAGSLRINLAAAHRSKRDFRAALAELDRATQIAARSLGPEHTQLATISLNVGIIHLEEARLDEAAAAFTRARDIWTKALGADHPKVGTTELRLGEVALRRGDTEAATKAFLHVHKLWAEKLGAEHPSLSTALSALGDAAMARELPGEASRHYANAVKLLEKALGPDNGVLAEPLQKLARAKLSSKRAKEAIEHLERAIGLLEAARDKPGAAKARFELAKALPPADASRAVTLAKQAHDALAARPESASDATAIESWLREREP